MPTQIEEGIGNPPHVTDPAALVAMMSELREGLRRADSQLIMGAFVSVNATDQIATGNDYNKLVGSFDFFAIMAYDMLACACGAGFGAPCGPNIIGPRAHHCGIAGANAPLQFIDLFLSQWLALPGLQNRQLMLILPAVGFWFRCDSKDPNLAPGDCKIVTSNRISHNRASLSKPSSLSAAGC